MASDLSIPISSTATASSTGRSKVALKPGRSLMDWIRLTHSGKDLTSTGGKCLEISPRELAKHNTQKDAWISLRGRVYNITHYLEYHPGGEDELMRGAGKDATDLFNQVHRWVNAETMLEKCFIGFLKKSWSFDAPKLPTLKNLKFKQKPASVPDNPSRVTVTVPDSACQDSLVVSENSTIKTNTFCNDKGVGVQVYEENKDDACRTNVGKFEWSISPSESDNSDTSIRFEDAGDDLKLVVNHSSGKHQGLITDLVDKKLFLKISYSPTCIYNIELPTQVKDNFKVKTLDEGEVEISLQMLDRTTASLDLQRIHWMLCKPNDELVYWSCKLISKVSVNYNTFLFTFQLPLGAKMWVPVGHHIYIKSYIEEVEVIRSYTPVISLLNSKIKTLEEEDGSMIVLMIKIYPMGTITPMLNRYSIGDSIMISNYVGSFSEALLASCDSVTMLAAGTGITPMIKIIHWIMNAKDKIRSMLLLFFNKKEEDILWREELKSCEATYNEFRVIDILSEPNEKWAGLTGQLSEDILDQLISVKVPDNKQKIFVCGPLPFTENALRFLEGAGHGPDDVYAFTGS